MKLSEIIEEYWYLPIVFGLVMMLSLSIFASGKIDSYYVNQKNSDGISYYCLYGDVNWRPDPTVYCSEDISKVLMLAMVMNAQKNPGVQLPQSPTPKTQTQ